MLDENEYITNIEFIKFYILNPLQADQNKMGSKKGCSI